MNMRFAFDDAGPAFAPIYPRRELGAYEALWLEKGATFKTLADRFAKDPAALPSDLVPAQLADQCAAEVMKIAEKIGRTPAQVALAWVRQGQGVVIPLVGAKTREQLDDNLGCLEFELDPVDKAALDEASHIDLGFPHDFLAQFKTDKVIDHRA